MKLQVETITELLEPVQFILGPKRITVIEIIDRWPSVDHSYFKLQADDGNLYILRHDENADQWEMTYFQAGDQD
jgi:hypothetical protein